MIEQPVAHTLTAQAVAAEATLQEGTIQGISDADERKESSVSVAVATDQNTNEEADVKRVKSDDTKDSGDTKEEADIACVQNDDDNEFNPTKVKDDKIGEGLSLESLSNDKLNGSSSSNVNANEDVNAPIVLCDSLSDVVETQTNFNVGDISLQKFLNDFKWIPQDEPVLIQLFSKISTCADLFVSYNELLDFCEMFLCGLLSVLSRWHEKCCNRNQVLHLSVNWPAECFGEALDHAMYVY